MKNLNLLAVVAASYVLAFASCDDKPSNAQIRQQISRHYNGSTAWVEAGKTLVDEIQILRLEKIDEKAEPQSSHDQWVVEALLKGSYGDSSGTPGGHGQEFDDKVRFRFEKNAHGIWVGQEIPKYQW